MGAPPCGVVWKRIRFGIRLTPLEKSEVEVDNVGAPPCRCCLETNSALGIRRTPPENSDVALNVHA